MVNSAWIYLVPLTFPLVAVVAGVLSKGDEADRRMLIGSAAGALYLAILAASTHEHGVSTQNLVMGILLAGILLGALPIWAYFRLGRALAPHPILVGAIVVMTAPIVLYVLYLFGGLMVLDLTSCPPDAYECPV